MSISLSNVEKQAFMRSKQKASIVFYPIVGESITLTESDIISLTINRSTMSGNKIGVGEVMANELDMELFNGDGRFDDIVFEGGELFVRIGVKWGSDSDLFRIENDELIINSSVAEFGNSILEIHGDVADLSNDELSLLGGGETFINYGYFTVDKSPKKSAIIKLTALDRMAMFDKPFNAYQVTFPINIYTLYDYICTYCNVAKDTTDFSGFANSNYVINEFDGDGVTCRQILSWICEILGVNAYFNVNGRLVLGWYKADSNTITMADTYNYDVDENAVTITGVVATKGKEYYSQGADIYRIAISDNPLIGNDIQTVVNNIASKVVGFTYTPFSADILSMVWLLPLDVIAFNNGNTTFNVIVSDTLYKMNGKMAIEGKGETAQVESYATLNPLTEHERAIIREIEKSQNETLNTRVQDAIAFNETISGAFGLFTYKELQSNGSYKYYLHNTQDINDSTIIFGFTDGGYAWASSWNGGDPIWTTGVTSDGNALFKLLSAEGISVSKVGEQYSVKVLPTEFQIMYGNTVVTVINRDEMQIPKVKTTDYYQLGNVRMSPYYSNGVMNGINFVFVD